MAIILLTTFVCLQFIFAAVLLWPTTVISVAPVLPRQAAAIADALEALPAEDRPSLTRAFAVASVHVHLGATPAVAPGSRPLADRPLLWRYRTALGDRWFRMDARTSSWWSAVRRQDHRSVVRLTIQLRDGSYFWVERASEAPIRGLTGQGALLGALVGLTVIGSLLFSFRETARPVAQLARATRAFMIDGETGDLEEQGPREVRDLANALNTMRARVRHLVEDRTRMLAAIAHDMRTYLTRIRLRVEMLEDEQERRLAVADISEMSALLDDTLLYAGEQARPASRALEALDLRAELAAFCSIRAAMGEPVTFDDHPLPMLVIADRLAVRRILNNLVDNALRFGHQAHVSLSANATHAEIRVEDQGPGISEDLRAVVQEPFVRLEESRGRQGGGAGLGLAIVKALVTAQGGIFELSQAPSGGLRAVVLLRRHADAGKAG